MTVVPIRPASTIVVLRDAPGGLEVFLVRRTFSIAFMAGAHVFPGGRVDAADEDAGADWCDGPGREHAVRGPAPAFWVAALRELFEEAGVLLARTADGAFATWTDGEAAGPVAGEREALHAGTESLRAIVERRGLRLALDSLVPFAHWVTPPIEVRRLDTWFFVAACPPGQVPTHDAHESIDSGWFRPGTALEACRLGRINLPPPTWMTLCEIERFETAAAALAWAGTTPIPARQPEVRHVDGAREILVPAMSPDADGASAQTRFVWVEGRWLPEGDRA